MYVVYALEDPRTGDIRYVGLTDNVQRRFIEHLHLMDNNAFKNTWLSELLAEGFVPYMRTLERLEALMDAREREAYWIGFYGGSGLLTNRVIKSSMCEGVGLELRRRLGWTQRELSRRARLDYNTVRKAETGQPVSGRTATSIASALSEALGERVLVEDIEGLNVSL